MSLTYLHSLCACVRPGGDAGAAAMPNEPVPETQSRPAGAAPAPTSAPAPAAVSRRSSDATDLRRQGLDHAMSLVGSVALPRWRAQAYRYYETISKYVLTIVVT